jgi:sulfate adenylyltransferase
VEGLSIPEWFSFPEILHELRIANPTRDKQGLTIFFTGLSGAGKSTLAKVLMIRLLEMGKKNVTLLDGDIVRKHLSSELGFSREHRDLNVRRIGFVASEITKNNGIAICAPIAPYHTTRQDVRAMIEPLGGFFEIHVATPLHICEGRDRKGLYAKARAGIVKEFTGISDPYDLPENPELTIDTTNISVDEAVQEILLKLKHEKYVQQT